MQNFRGAEQGQTECIMGHSKIEYSVMRDEGKLVRSDMTVYQKGWGYVTRNGRLPNYPTLSWEWLNGRKFDEGAT